MQFHMKTGVCPEYLVRALMCVARLRWLVHLHEHHARMGGVGGAPAWLACHRYWYCCYWWVISWRKKYWMFNFETKIKKMFQINLNSDLKEEPDLKSRCWFTLFEAVMPGSWTCLNLLRYAQMRYANMLWYVRLCECIWIWVKYYVPK